MNIFLEHVRDPSWFQMKILQNDTKRQFFKMIPSLGTKSFPQVLKMSFFNTSSRSLAILDCSPVKVAIFHHSDLSDFNNSSLSLVLRLRRGSFTSQLEGEATAIDRSSAAKTRYIHGVFSLAPLKLIGCFFLYGEDS